MGRSNARGFSLLELMIAAAVVTIVVWLLFHALSQTLLAARMQTQDDREQSTIGQLVDSLTTEQDDAWAIYVPPTDVLGKSNSDGHEVDFFARDGKQRPYFWAYSYDKTAQRLTRYRFASPGGVPAQDTTYTGITKFYTHTYPLTALQDPLTPVYSTLYNSAALQSGIVHFYPGMPWIAGGNDITYVHVEGASMKQDLQLATNTAPSGFTVVVYYTPSPSPTPTFKTWPAQLLVGVSGTKPWTSTAGQACSALAENAAGTAADTSLPSASPVRVDSNGCELDSTGSALAQPVILAYDPSGASETFRVSYNGCSSGAAQVGPWNPYNGTGATVQLDVIGQSAGTCNVTLSDGVAVQAPGSDAGLVSVGVVAYASTQAVDEVSTYTPCASSTHWCASGITKTTTMTYYESTGSGWTQVGTSATNYPPGYNGGDSSTGFKPTSFAYTCSATGQIGTTTQGTWSPSIPPNDTMDSTCYYTWEKVLNG